MENCYGALFPQKKTKDPTNPANYRPISLLPCFAKVFEKIIKHRINYQLENNGQLHAKQYGFREKRSAELLLKTVKNDIDSLMTEYKYTAFISFDIQGAFDNLNHDIIRREIESLKIPLYLKKILINYLHNTKIGVYVSNVFIPYDYHRGCPQGSCLGPLIWLIVSNSILENYDDNLGHIYAYADDFALLISENSRAALEYKVNLAVQNFVSLCDNLNLVISFDKTNSIVYGVNMNRPPIFNISGNRIKVSHTLDYLGIRFSQLNTWTEHLDKIRNKVFIFTNNLYRFKGVNWGISSEIIKIWYNTVIYKQIYYGACVWFPALNSKGIKKLLSIQRLSLIYIIKGYRTTATSSLQVLAGVIPIDINIYYDLKIFNLFQFREDVVIGNTLYYSNDFESRAPLYSIDVTYSEHKKSFVNFNEFVNYASAFYTDGSKTPSGTALAFVYFKNGCPSYNYSNKLNKVNTVYQAEIMAIYLALKWAINNNLNNIYIFTDSLSFIEAAKNVYCLDELINEINILIANSSIYVNFGWVPGHTGIIGNEIANYYAQKAANTNNSDPEIYCKSPKSYIKRLAHIGKLNDWQIRWNSEPTGRHTYDFIPKVDENFICNSPVLVYFVTGHGAFPSYLNLRGIRPDPLCHCGKVGTPDHYLFENCSLMKSKFSKPNTESLDAWFKRNFKNYLFFL